MGSRAAFGLTCRLNNDSTLLRSMLPVGILYLYTNTVMFALKSTILSSSFHETQAIEVHKFDV
jgi:hypothetical protein